MKTGAVTKYLDSIDDGTVFAISDISVETTQDSLKTQLSVACSKGRIIRVMRGIYHKPKYSELIGKTVPYDLDEVAHAIARFNGWHIIHDSNACLNLTGLSTQVPSHFVYYSDGPYKHYNIGNMTIEMRHRAPKDMPDSGGLTIMIHALKAKGKGNLSPNDILTLSEYARSHNVQLDPDRYNRTAPWIRDQLQRIGNEQPL